MKNKKNRFFLTNEEIQQDIDKMRALEKSGQIQQKIIPDYWCKGENTTLNKKLLVLFAFLGFLGLDRIYLKKYVSSGVKIFFTLVVPIIFSVLLYWVSQKNNFSGVNSKETELSFFYLKVNVIIFASIFYLVFIGFYVTDIVIAIIKPRDNEFRCVI
ncbi:hypothetical protein V2E24_01445 [Mycoplasmopsis ciconiae]|uniref:TM2 domain-containing protein n=1 Tax=Mycoplasmopsis ciconiae TaxID=561067 RepID=A0ABU7ML28_9BACT|nr:hypothetical protein [Mycoplasmopsis ciconiae]